MSAGTGFGLDDPFYVAFGGTMKPDALSYVWRKADEDLLGALLEGDFCYVLSPRQMGKSSLMVRTAAKLAERGVRSVQIDLSPIGKSVSAEQWFFGIAKKIKDALGIPIHLEGWWESEKGLPVTQRLTNFLRGPVLGSCPQRIVIFVDEIDTTIGLSFSDDFFATIRNFYNLRSLYPAFERLTIALLGVATPSELIKDTARTPFNIGRPIQLRDFGHDEAVPLAQYLDETGDVSAKLLQRILYWTDGHPYLTQRLCSAVAKAKPADVDELVRGLFLTERVKYLQDPNLQNIRDRVADAQKSIEILRLYLEVLTKPVVKFDANSPIHASLVLTGVVKSNETSELKVRNRIYAQVFSEAWVRLQLPVDVEWKPVLPDDVREAYVVHEALRKSTRFHSEAYAALADFWEVRGCRDEALLIRLKQYQENRSAEAAASISNLIGKDYSRLRATCLHDGAIQNVLMKEWGGKVLTASADRTSRVWSLLSGQRIAECGDTDTVRAIAFSQSGVFAASGGDAGSAIVWSAQSGQIYKRPIKHGASIRAVAFSPDGRSLFTAGADGLGRLWDVDSGEQIYAPVEHPYIVLWACFNASGDTIFTGGKNKLAYLWRAETGEQVAVLAHNEDVTSFAFSGSGDSVVTGSEDEMARVWSTRAGGPLTHAFNHGGGAVTCVAFCDDRKLIATGGADRTVCLWRLDTGNQLGTRMWHHSGVTAVAFDSWGNRLASGEADGIAREWSTYTCQSLSSPLRHDSEITSVCFAPDGSGLLTCGGALLRFWGGEEENTPDQPVGIRCAESGILQAAVSDDGSLIATLTAKGKATLQSIGESEGQGVRDFDRGVTAVALSKDGNTLCTGGDDGSVEIWQTSDGQLVYSSMCHAGKVTALAFSPDRTRLASGGVDRNVRLLDAADGTLIGDPLGHRLAVSLLSFSPDSISLLSVGSDAITRFWLGYSGDFIGSINHLSRVTAVAWTADSKYILAGTEEGIVQLWEVPTATAEDSRQVFQIKLHEVPLGLTHVPESHTFLIVTHNWLYAYRVEKEEPLLACARLLDSRWAGGLRWDAEKAAVELWLSDTPCSVYPFRYQLAETGVLAGENDPNELLANWQRKLGRILDKDSRISAAYARR